MSTTPDLVTFIQACREQLALAGATLEDEYHYHSLPLCVIDAVFSIGGRYRSTQNTVSRFAQFFGLPLTAKPFPAPTETQMSIDAFLKCYADYGLDRMTADVYQNRQRTSTRRGILKAEAVHQFARTLAQFDVQYIQDVARVRDNNLFADAIRAIPGQRSGISLDYFYMLTGSEDDIKADRMVNRFVEQAIGRALSIEDTRRLIRAGCAALITDYPHLTPRLLDNIIWKYQRERKPS